MAQARVTDYFSQSKRAAVDRSLRSKSQKARSAEQDRAECEASVSKTRPQRSSRVQEDSEQLRSVQEEFLRVIDEAVSGSDLTQGSTEADKAGAPRSPRTPKRSSSEAEFDLCAAVFDLSSATEQHSTAKKRLRVAAKKETEPAGNGRRTARKKLVLSKHEETEKVKGFVCMEVCLFT